MAAAVNNVPYHSDVIRNPAYDMFVVTPNDNAPLQYMARGLYIGGAGNVTLLTSAGTQITLVAPAVGYVIPCLAVQVFATGTTATNIVGFV